MTGDEPKPDTPPTQPTEPVQDPAGHGPDVRETYNIITDTVAGPNVRLKDNLFQAVSAIVGGIIGALIGLVAIGGPIAGLLVGGVLGVIGGVFISGFVLMIYRAVMHAKGEH